MFGTSRTLHHPLIPVTQGVDVWQCRRHSLHPVKYNPSRAAKRTANPEFLSRSPDIYLSLAPTDVIIFLRGSFHHRVTSAPYPTIIPPSISTVAATLPNGTSNFIYDPLGSVLVINDCTYIAATVTNPALQYKTEYTERFATSSTQCTCTMFVCLQVHVSGCMH